MLLRELITPPPAVQPTIPQPAVIPAGTPPQELDPTPQEIKDVEQLIGSIDPQRETAQSMLNTITGWMRSHPLLDRITDIIPQTRLVKAIGAAVDAVEAKDTRKAIQALATVIGGSTAQAVNTVNRTVNTVSALQQNDPVALARAQGGTVGRLANIQQTLAPRL
jgi:hypothetical protein